MPETDANVFLLFIRRLNGLGIRYMVTGSVASIAYGEARLTHDVDIVVEIGREDVGRLAAAFPESDFYLPPSEVIRIEVTRAQRGHFNIIHHETGFKADVYPCGRDRLSAWGVQPPKRRWARPLLILEVDRDLVRRRAQSAIQLAKQQALLLQRLLGSQIVRLRHFDDVTILLVDDAFVRRARQLRVQLA